MLGDTATTLTWHRGLGVLELSKAGFSDCRPVRVSGKQRVLRLARSASQLASIASASRVGGTECGLRHSRFQRGWPPVPSATSPQLSPTFVSDAAGRAVPSGWRAGHAFCPRRAGRPPLAPTPAVWIDVVMECTITRLLKDGDRVCGAFGYRRATGEFLAFAAPTVVLATGGGGRS